MIEKLSSDLLRPVWRIHHHRLPKTVIHIGRHGVQNNRAQELSQIGYPNAQSYKWFLNATIAFHIAAAAEQSLSPGHSLSQDLSYCPSSQSNKTRQSAFPSPAAGVSVVSWQEIFVIMKGFLQGRGTSLLYADECIFHHSVCPLFAIPSSSVFHLKTTCNPCVWWLSILSHLQSSGGSKAAFINSVWCLNATDGLPSGLAVVSHHHGDRPPQEGSWASPFSTIMRPQNNFSAHNT